MILLVQIPVHRCYTGNTVAYAWTGRDARIPFFNISILSVSVKNYPYPYPIRIRGSIMVQLHRESKKNNSSDFFDSSFNIGCQILIVFWHRYTRFNTASNNGFSFPTSPNSFFCPTRETDKYKNRMPLGRGFDGFDQTPSAGT